MGYVQNLTPILVPLIFFAFLAAVILGPKALRTKERLAIMEMARRSLERGEPLPPELVEAFRTEEPRPTAERDLRRGATMIAVALGLVALALLVNMEEGEIIYPLLGSAFFPGLIGLVHLAFWAINRNQRPE